MINKLTILLIIISIGSLLVATTNFVSASNFTPTIASAPSPTSEMEIAQAIIKSAPPETSHHNIKYCNQGNDTLRNVMLEFAFNKEVSDIHSTTDYTITNDNNYIYKVGEIVPPGNCSSFKLKITYTPIENITASIASKPTPDDTITLRLKKQFRFDVKSFYASGITKQYNQSVYVDDLIMTPSYRVFSFNMPLNEDYPSLRQVISEYKQALPLNKQTISIDLIIPTQIDRWNTNSLDESISKMPGINVMDKQPDIRGGGGYAYGSGSRTLILVDGMPFMRGDAALADWNFVPQELTQQVEIIKGASSALYGSSALNGVINLRTIQPTAKPHTNISFHSGIYQTPRDNQISRTDANGNTIETQKAWWNEEETMMPFQSGFNLAHARKIGKLGLVLGGHSFIHNSWRKEETERRGRVSLKLDYQVNSRLKIALNTYYQRNRSRHFLIWNGKEENMYKPWESADILTNKGSKLVLDPIITYENPSANSKHILQTRYFKSDVFTRQDEQNDSDKSTFADMFYGEYQYQKQIPSEGMTLTSGINTTINSVRGRLYLDTTYASLNAAIYTQLNKSMFNNRLNVTLGGRLELNKISDKDKVDYAPVMKIGANYAFTNTTHLRASFGQGYRYPSIAEKYISTTFGVFPGINEIRILPKDDLKPEFSWNAELGIKQDFRIFSWKAYIDAAAFISHYNNMIEFTFNSYTDLDIGQDAPFTGLGFRAINAGSRSVIGAEFSLAGNGKLGRIPLNVLLGYTHINPRSSKIDSTNYFALPAGPNISEFENNNLLKFRIQHSFKSDIEASWKKTSLGFSANYNSFVEGIDNVFDILIPDLQQYRKENATGNWVLDARLSYRISRKNRITVHCKNLLNKEYTLRPALIEAPRNFQVRYTYKF